MLLLVRNPQRGICLADMPWSFLFQCFICVASCRFFFSNKGFVLPVHFVSFSFNIRTNDISFTFLSFQVMPHQGMALRLGSVLTYHHFVQLETEVRVNRAVRSEHYHVWSYPFFLQGCRAWWGVVIWTFSLYLYLHLLEEELVVWTETDGENWNWNMRRCRHPGSWELRCKSSHFTYTSKQLV